MIGFLATTATLLNQLLGIFARKVSQTDMTAFAADVWEGYAPNWTPSMVLLGFIIMAVTIVASVVSVKRGRITGGRAFFGVLLVFYLYLMYGSTVFTRTPNAVRQYNTDFLWEYRAMFANRSWYYAKQIGLNILMFVPIGVLYPLWRGRRCFVSSMGFGLLCTLAIELMQLYFKCGMFEYDDIFNNMLGMFVGYMVIRLFLPKHKKAGHKKKRKKKR